MENEYYESYKKYEPFFGGWYIRRLIGEGSYGKVFEIERRDPFGTVYTSALKVITVPPNSSGLEAALSDGMDRNSASLYFRDCVKELNREIALMSKLKGHSNIVSYEDHDVFQHEDGVGWDILIRMELLTPITRYLKDNRIFSHREVVQLGIDLCRALELCQRYNIIHRDIKPANIFLSDAQDFKLGDFGVARVAGAATAAYTRVGTLNYMAPEIFAGREYSGSVDIYSLGLVMYQLLNANRMPFYPPYPEPITYAAQERAHARRLGGEALPAPANTPDALARIVLKACAPDPADRYKDPALMRHELEAVQNAVADPDATMLMPEPVEHQPVSEEKTAVMPQENTGEREKRLQEEQQRAAEEERLRMEREEAQRQKLLEEKEAELARAEEEKRKAEKQARQEKVEAGKKPTPVKNKKSKKLPILMGTVAVAAVVAVGGIALASRNSILLGPLSSVASAFASAVTVESGSCGAGVTWELMSDGTMYIRKDGKGSGAMKDYHLYTGEDTASRTDAPWDDEYRKSIKQVIVEKGVTSIGDNAFYRCTALKEIELPDGIIRIGDNAFWGATSLEKVDMPESVTVVESMAFAFCTSLKEVNLSPNIKKMSYDAFFHCDALT